MFGKWVKRRKGFWATSHLWWRSWRRGFSEADGTGVRPITGAGSHWEILRGKRLGSSYHEYLKDVDQTWMRMRFRHVRNCHSDFLHFFHGKSRRVFRSMKAQKQRSQTGFGWRKAWWGGYPQKYPKVIRSNWKSLKKIKKDTPWYSHLH